MLGYRWCEASSIREIFRWCARCVSGLGLRRSLAKEPELLTELNGKLASRENCKVTELL